MSQEVDLKCFQASILLEDGSFYTVCTLQAPDMATAAIAFPRIFPKYIGIMTVIGEITAAERERLVNDPNREPAHRCPVCGFACTAVYENQNVIAVCQRCGNQSGLKEATP